MIIGYFLPKSVLQKYRKSLLVNCLLLMSIISAYSINRRIKDIVIQYAVGSSIITLIKIIITPTITICFLVYTFVEASNMINREYFFYIVSVPFILFFLIYSILLITGDFTIFKKFSFTLIPKIIQVKISSIKYLSLLSSLIVRLNMISNNLIEIIFYISSEIYGSLLSFFFWSHLNMYINEKQASIQVPLILASTGFSQVLSGLLGISIPFLLTILNLTGSYKNIIFFNLSFSILFIVLSLVFYRISLREMKYIYSDEYSEVKSVSKKVKLGIKESLMVLYNNKLIRLIFIGTISYTMLTNFTDISWKDSKRDYFSNPISYNRLDSIVQTIAGISNLMLSKIYSKTFSVLGLVSTMLLASILTSSLCNVFIISYLLVTKVASLSYLLWIPVLIGTIQSILSKTMKYTFTDTSVFIIFSKLDSDLRSKGRAANDLLGTKYGKGISSSIQEVLISSIVPLEILKNNSITKTKYIGSILFIMSMFISVMWVYSIIKMKYELLSYNKPNENSIEKEKEIIIEEKEVLISKEEK